MSVKVWIKSNMKKRKVNRRGEHRCPLYAITCNAKIHMSILDQNNTTNYGVESWNARWNNTIETNY